MSEFVHEL